MLGRTGSVLTTMVSAFLPDTGTARTVVLSTTTVGTMTVTGTIEITTNENHREPGKAAAREPLVEVSDSRSHKSMITRCLFGRPKLWDPCQNPEGAHPVAPAGP